MDELDGLIIFLNSEWEKEQPNIRKFLKSFGSTNIRNFLIWDLQSILNSDRNDFYTVLACSNIFLELRHVISRVTNKIDIWNLELKGKEFCQLVRASIHAFELEFWNCKILTETEFDFGQMEGCKIHALKIDYRVQVYDSESDYEDFLMKIFEAIIHWSNLFRNLKKLSFRCNNNMKDLLLKKNKGKT